MTITAKPPGSAGNPNSVNSETANTLVNPIAKTAESAGALVNPISKTAESAGDLVNPIAKTSETAGALVNPIVKTAETASTLVNPISKTAEAAGSLVNPISKTAETAGDLVNPIAKTAVTAAGFPRSLTPLVQMDFAAGCYSQCGNPVLFDDLFTYSRNSSATFINRRVSCNGGYEYFLDTDYVGSVTNLATYSEQIDHADWTKTSTTVIANNSTDENGNKIADRIYPTSTGTLRGVSQAITATTADHDVSFKVKAAGLDWVKIFDAADTNGAWFNVKQGIIGTISGTPSAKIEPLENGYFRCSIADAGAVSGTAKMILADADNSTTATTSGTNGVLMVGGQLTLGYKPLPYVKTTTTSASETFAETLRVEYDLVSAAVLGALIEGSSTNLALRSEEFDNPSWTKTNSTVVANTAVAPDGTTSADLIYPTTTGTLRGLSDLFTGTVDDYTVSFFVKSSGFRWIRIVDPSGSDGVWFDIISGVVGTQQGASIGSIKDLGEGWFRCSVVDVGAVSSISQIVLSDADNSNTSTTSGTSGLYIWGAQAEQQSFVTSYIRTEGSSATRAADRLSFPSAGNAPISGDMSRTATFSKNSNDVTQRYLAEIPSTDGASFMSTSSGVSRERHGGSAFDSTTTIDPNIEYTLTDVFDGSSNLLSVYTDGLLSGSLAQTTQFELDVSAEITIGTNNSFSGPSATFGHMKTFSIYDKALTAQEASLL